MQIVRPDMLPLVLGFLILFLFFVGIAGIIFLYHGLKKRNKWRAFSISNIILGCLALGFVIYNWVGYNSIFTEHEKLIIGEYRCKGSKLTIKPDYSWHIKGRDESLCKHGKWEYVMSEDWCYWNVESENLKCRTQVGTPEQNSPKSIIFKEQNLDFKRIKNPFVN